MDMTDKQPGNTECGFYVAAWLEEAVRHLRGEGVFRVDVSLLSQIAMRLTQWNAAVLTAWNKSGSSSYLSAASPVGGEKYITVFLFKN